MNLIDKLPGLQNLFDAGDHREHNAEVAFGAGAQDRPQLDFKQFRFSKTQPDGAYTQERIGFGRHVQIGQLFITAGIQGAYDNGQVLHSLRNGR